MDDSAIMGQNFSLDTPRTDKNLQEGTETSQYVKTAWDRHCKIIHRGTLIKLNRTMELFVLSKQLLWLTVG